MSNPLVVVIELDGFQHGPDELTPRCLAVACDALQLASQWFFQTGFLASRPREYLSTYYHQSTFVHGLPLTGPGLSQGFFPNVLRNALDELIIDYYRLSRVAPAPDHFLLFTKGANKLELFEDALSPDFFQPSFLLFCDVVISWSVSINRALIIPVFRFYIADLSDCTSYVNELKIKPLKSKFESYPVSSCSRSGTLE